MNKKVYGEEETQIFVPCLLTLGKQYYLILSKHPKYTIQIMLFNYKKKKIQCLDFDAKLLYFISMP